LDDRLSWSFNLSIPSCRRAYFLLLRQKKVAKEKATPGSVALRAPLRYSALAGAAELGLRPQTVLAHTSASPCVARHLSWGPEHRSHFSTYTPAPTLPPSPLAGEGLGERGRPLVCPTLPCDALSSADWRGGISRGLSEAEGRVPQAPRQSSSARHPVGARSLGRLFFGYFLLAKQKKVRTPVNGGTNAKSNTTV